MEYGDTVSFHDKHSYFTGLAGISNEHAETSINDPSLIGLVLKEARYNYLKVLTLARHVSSISL